jgi:hypothetical protein
MNYRNKEIEMNELKPCPFCGGEAHRYRHDMTWLERLVGCATCGIDDMTEGEWNSRAPQSEWISVKDELPEPVKTVLVNIVNDATDGSVFEAIHQIDGDFLLKDDLLLKGLAANPCVYVTHWMPMPESPREI